MGPSHSELLANIYKITGFQVLLTGGPLKKTYLNAAFTDGLILEQKNEVIQSKIYVA